MILRVIDLLAIFTGALLVIAAGVGIFITRGGTFRLLFRIIFTSVTVVIFASLVLIAISSLVLQMNPPPKSFRSFMHGAWKETVGKDSGTMSCDIENKYDCRGYYDKDCVGCDRGGRECSPEQKEICPACGNYRMKEINSSGKGCYKHIVDEHQKYYLPLGCAATIAGCSVLVNIILVWVIKEREWFQEY